MEQIYQRVIMLENEIKQKRMDLVKDYLIKNQININLVSTDEDLMSFYSCLSIKARHLKTEVVNELLDELKD